MLPPEKFKLVNGDKERNEYLFENQEYLPRAYFADTVIVAGKSKTYEILNSQKFNPRSMAIVSENVKTKLEKSENSSVKIEKYSAHRIEISTISSATSLLVLSEVYYPNGWKAFINGDEVRIFKTNNLLRSVVVPSGNNRVEFVYESSMYNNGLMISYFGWSATLLLILIGFINRNKMNVTAAAILTENS
jgi:uncharacterized membrane protein YfhO